MISFPRLLIYPCPVKTPSGDQQNRLKGNGSPRKISFNCPNLFLGERAHLLIGTKNTHAFLSIVEEPTPSLECSFWDVNTFRLNGYLLIFQPNRIFRQEDWYRLVVGPWRAIPSGPGCSRRHQHTVDYIDLNDKNRIVPILQFFHILHNLIGVLNKSI